LIDCFGETDRTGRFYWAASILTIVVAAQKRTLSPALSPSEGEREKPRQRPAHRRFPLFQWQCTPALSPRRGRIVASASEGLLTQVLSHDCQTILPPHEPDERTAAPALSPSEGERGNHRQRVSNGRFRAQSTKSSENSLPGGEGRGGRPPVRRLTSYPLAHHQLIRHSTYARMH
jgi:hypothetical protein